MLASFFFTASYLQDFILVGPLILYGISFIYFLKKRRGAFNIVHCIFEKKSANSCRMAENQKCKLEVCKSPIAWYFQYILRFSTLLFIISNTFRYRRYIIPCKLLENS